VTNYKNKKLAKGTSGGGGVACGVLGGGGRGGQVGRLGGSGAVTTVGVRRFSDEGGERGVFKSKRCASLTKTSFICQSKRGKS